MMRQRGRGRPSVATLLVLALVAGCDSGGSVPVSGSGGTSGMGGAGGNGGGGGTGTPITASVTVSGADPIAVAPTFFGENYWSWVPDWGDPVAAVEAQTADLGLGLLRAGGANNDRQDPIPFSLDEVDDFVTYARAVGAEPLIQVPVVKDIAGEAATPQDAADLVTYVNVTQGYGVKFFSIGNEPDLYEEQGLMPAGYDAAAFCATFREFATAMRAVDNTIRIVGPDLSWKYQSGANDWLTPFLQDCGDVTDIIAVHRYPLTAAACTEAAAYADVTSYRSVLSHLGDILVATGQEGKPLAITEANITWDGDPANPQMPASPGTFPAALWVADNLGASLEAGLYSVDYWSLSEGYTLGIFSGTNPTPSYYAIWLFSTHFGQEVLTVTGAPAGVSVYAGRSAESSSTAVFVLNKTTNPLELQVAFQDLARTAPVSLQVAPTSLQMAIVADDGSASAVTSYSADMTAPTALP